MRLLFLSILLPILIGCKVSTSSSANIPKEKVVVEDTIKWNKILNDTTLESSSSSNFKVSKMVVDDGNTLKSALEMVVLFGDDDKIYYSKLIKSGKFTLDSLVRVSYYDLNLSERVVFLETKVENKTIEIWLDKNLITPFGEYIDDINLNNQLYSIYKSGDLIVLDKDTPTKSYSIRWQDLINALVQKEILTKPKSLNSIFFGVKMVRGRELFVINEFNISK